VNSLLLNATLASFIFLLGLGEMLVMTSGEGAIDLSMPYVVTLSAYFAAAYMRAGNDRIIPGILMILVGCAVVGLINALINFYLKVHAMITTLATGYILFTAILLYGPHSQGAPNEKLAAFAQFQVQGFSLLTVVCIGIALVVAVVLYRTTYGRSLHAIGQGRRTAELAGIRVARTIFVTFVLSALLAGVTGILLGAYVGGAYLDMGNYYLMPSIATTLVGGTLVSGGKSSVAGTMGGALMLTLVQTFLTLTKLSAGLQYLIEGAILMLVLIAAKPKPEEA
jgi:ribose transport system permease protein